MPAGDGTGPMGMGPMTGRAAGYCAGYNMPGYANPIGGRGFGMGGGRGFGRGRRFGMGGGRGWRNMYYATGLTGRQRAGAVWPDAYPAAYTPPTREQQMDALKSQAEYFEETLNGLRQRMSEIEAQQTEK